MNTNEPSEAQRQRAKNTEVLSGGLPQHGIPREHRPGAAALALRNAGDTPIHPCRLFNCVLLNATEFLLLLRLLRATQ